MQSKCIRSRHPINKLSALALWGTFLLLHPATFAVAQPLTFSAMADIPYGSSEVSTLLQQIEKHNLFSPSAFMVHLGDIKSGSGSCSESVYSNMAGYLRQLHVPTYIIPGDNEYNDCSNPQQAWSYWETYFADFERNFANPPVTERQSVRRENFAFTMNGVLLVGINLVAGSAYSQTEWNTRLQDDADWVKQQLQEKGGQVRAAVVFGHAGRASNRALFFDQFIKAARDFGKPVLYMHGDGHSWKMDRPFSAQNILRVQLDNGGAEDPVQVTVTLDDQDIFKILRNPFSGTQQQFTLSTSTVGSGSINLNPSGGLYANGKVVTLTANPEPGWVFDSWSGDLSGSENPATITMNGNKSVTATFTLIEPPAISSFSPTSGPFGTEVTITGSNFISVTQVAFSSVPATYFMVDSDNQIRVEVPADATTGQISVTTPGGPATSTEFFIVTPPQPPAITFFTPTSGPIGREITITGTYFTGAMEVAFNGVAAIDFTVVSNSQIRAEVPVGAATGKINVTAPGGTAASIDDFTVTSALVGHWQFDEGSGTTAADASGNGNDGTLVGGPAWSSGQSAGALSFDGQDDYVNCGNGASLNITGPITVALWAKSAGAPVRYDALLMKSNSSWTVGYGFFYNSSSDVRFFVTHWSTNVASATISNTTQWNHIAGVFDGANVRIYVNGIEGTPYPYTGVATSTAANLEIGRGASNAYNFNGMLDDVRVYNRALSQQEVQALAAGNQAPVANAGPDQTVTDADGNGSENVTLDGSGSSDPDGAITSFVWREGGAQIATGVSPTVSLAVGTHAITLTVTDDDGATGTDAVAITVNPDNFPPVASAGPDQTVTDGDGDGSENVTLDGAGSSDQDGTIVSYAWSEGGNPIATGANPTVTLAVGTHTITLTVTDDKGATGTDEVVITVNTQPTDLAGHWPFDEGSGNTTADVSGNGNNGTLVGGPTWGTGQSGAAFSFDGVDDYVNCGNDASLDITEKITVSLWTKSESLPGQYDVLLMKTNDTKWADGYGIYYNGNSEIRFYVSHWNDNVASATINPTQWNHIAGVYDGSTVRIYVNGVEGTSDPYTGGITSTSADLEIGRGASNAYNIQGLIDEVRIYNRALSAEEIQALATGNQAPVADAGPDLTVENMDGDGSASVTLDGTGSTDADGTIASYMWSEGGSQIATGVNPTVNLALGIHLITLTVTDDAGTSDTDDVVIFVTGTDLAGYWPLDEGSATTAADASGNGNNGTLVGGPAWSTGLLGRALSFDGVDDYVTCGNGASLDITGEITVALWTKSASLPARYDALVMKTSSTSWTDGYGLFYNGDNEVRFFVSHWNTNVASAPISPTQWNHIAGVFDGSTVRIYVNGVEGTSDTYTGVITPTTANVEIGRGASNAYNVNALIDEVRIYNRALSAAEIQALVNQSTSSALTAKSSNSEPEVNAPDNIRPKDFHLAQNYPNPFNPTTVIRYDLPEPVHVKLVIYDLLGHQVRTLVDAAEPAGFRHIAWDGTNDAGQRVASGSYLIRMEACTYAMTRQILLLK